MMANMNREQKGVVLKMNDVYRQGGGEKKEIENNIEKV